MLRQVLKDSFNAYAFIILVIISIALGILSMFFMVFSFQIYSSIISGLWQVLSLIFITVYFMATRHEPGLAGSGLVLGIIGVLGSMAMRGLGNPQTFELVAFGLSNLLFSIALLKQEGIPAKLLSWCLIIVSCYNLWKSIAGYLGSDTASIIVEVVGMGISILLQVATLYYIISESEAFKPLSSENH